MGPSGRNANLIILEGLQFLEAISYQHGLPNAHLKMTDRRRINGPLGGTSTPVYSKYLAKGAESQTTRPTRTRAPNVLRKMCMVEEE